MSQKESGWEKEFEKRFIGYEKVSGGIGLSYVTDVDNPYLKNDISGIKDFIQETLSNREKEIAEEVEKINNKANTGEYLQAKEHAKEHETALNTGAYEATNEVLQLLKH